MSTLVKYDGDSKLLNKLKERSKMTPDYPVIKFRMEHLVFVYDELQDGTFEAKTQFEGAQYAGRAITLNTNFRMKMDGRDGPVVFDYNGDVRGAIEGCAYVCGPQHILNLDGYYNNNVKMKRVLKKIVLFDQKDATSLNGVPIVREKQYRQCYAWMYLGIEKAWENFGLLFKPLRQNMVKVDAIRDRPKYEFDPYESDNKIWDEWGRRNHNSKGNFPALIEMMNDPMNEAFGM